jgi:hypothetical protein
MNAQRFYTYIEKTTCCLHCIPVSRRRYFASCACAFKSSAVKYLRILVGSPHSVTRLNSLPPVWPLAHVHSKVLVPVPAHRLACWLARQHLRSPAILAPLRMRIIKFCTCTSLSMLAGTADAATLEISHHFGPLAHAHYKVLYLRIS